ncbi:thymopoietin isoform X1 [Petaurus breviceps papuanus]|uniref:thymopoietin isoform X1 n=1 Tax=Petaurus breviceps papuanus TaxID=3040969 RepID=UPI0036DCC82D
MPEFLEDPSVLTKDRLKSELLANNVTLPAGEQRKDVYVQLYLQHLTARNRPPPAQPPPLAPAANSRAPPDFSSDDEREPTPVLSAAGRGRGGGAAAGRKATKKTDKPRSEEKDDFDVTELTNEELLSQLVKYGVNPGPIVGTTRKLYEKKLLKLREHGPESRSSTPLPAVSSSSENARQNGNDDSDRYSDNEEGKKKEHKKVKSTRESVRISELPTSPSGGFFQAVSFPEIRARPPLGWTELQAAKRGHSSNRDPFREPLNASSSLGIGQAEKVVSGEDLFDSLKYGQDRFLGESLLSSSQTEPFATLASASAKPSCSPALKDPIPKCLRDHLENICGRNKSEFGSSFTERAYSLAHSVLSQNREKPDILDNSQVITPPLAEAIRDYVNSLLIKAGASNLPGISNPNSANVENPQKRVCPSQFQETESRCSLKKFPRLHERSAKEGDSGFLHASQDNVAPSAFAKAVISQSLSTLGIETPKECQHDTLNSPEPSFPLHESILKVIDEEWSHIDKEIPSVASKYPVSSRETAHVLSVPKVDDDILELTSEVTSPASTQACNKQLDLALCRTYEAATGALQIAAHIAFVARAIQTDIGQVAQILSSDPSQIPEAVRTLSKTYDAASFLCDAAFDEVRMAACGMGSSTVGRRHLWLNNVKVSPTHKNKLSVLPFRGGTLFGGEVQKVIKKHGKRQ